MLRIGALHINTDRPGVLADFYQQVLNTNPSFANDDIAEFTVNDFRLIIMRHSEVSGKNPAGARLIVDFTVDDVEAEFDRLLDIGASVVAEPYEFDTEEALLHIATLADPDGNYFQLVSIDQ